MGSRAGNALRSVTYRISSIPPAHLPIVLPSIAHALLDCKSLLSAPPASVLNTPDGVALHKFKVQVSTLLNDSKNPSARWAAVVLIKAAIDLGGWEILQANSGPWVRGLLSVLGRAVEAPATKKLCVVALTRIFLFTHEYPTLIREITTPALPAFITACLNLVGCSKNSKTSHTARQAEAQAQFLETVLCSFEHLLPYHPSIFRTFMPQIQPLLLSLMAPTPSDPGKEVSLCHTSAAIYPEVLRSAQSLFCLLPFCAPKLSSSQEWEKSFVSLISDTHATCNLVFRSIIEDWQSSAGIEIPQIVTVNNIASLGISPIGLPAWTTIDAGCERVYGLLGLIQAFVSCSTAAQASFPMGRLADLLIRITSVTASISRSSVAATNMRINEQISRDEREILFTSLPFIHVLALSVIQSICDRFGTAILPIAQSFIEQITWVFRHESYNTGLRKQCYNVLSSLIEIAGKAMTKDQIISMIPILKASCTDIIPTTDQQHSPSPSTNSQQAKTSLQTQPSKMTKSTTIHADTFLASFNQAQNTTSSTKATTPLKASALHLITTILTHTPQHHLPRTLRAQLDRTAVLSGDLPVMLASVLNPAACSHASSGGKENSSILPLLARAHSRRAEVEGVIRPRVVGSLVSGVERSGLEDDLDMDGEEEEEEPEEDELDGNVDVDVEMDRDAEDHVLDDTVPMLDTTHDNSAVQASTNLVTIKSNDTPATSTTAPTPSLAQPPLPPGPQHPQLQPQPHPIPTTTTTTTYPPETPPPSSTTPLNIPKDDPSTTTSTTTTTSLKRSLPSTEPTNQTITITSTSTSTSTSAPTTKRPRLDPTKETSETPIFTSTSTSTNQEATAPATAAASAVVTRDGGGDGSGSDDDDDDFEIPELNIEQDTEDEDENDVENEDEEGEVREDELGGA